MQGRAAWRVPHAAQPAAPLARPRLQVVRRPVVVAGNSIGGFISASMAGDYPGLVEGLVLLNSAGGANGGVPWRGGNGGGQLAGAGARQGLQGAGLAAAGTHAKLAFAPPCNPLAAIRLVNVYPPLLETPACHARAGKIEAGYEPPAVPPPVTAPPPFVVDAVSRVSRSFVWGLWVERAYP